MSRTYWTLELGSNELAAPWALWPASPYTSVFVTYRLATECRRNGSPNGDGPPLLRAALVALERHYRKPLEDQLAEAASRAPRHVDVPAPQPVTKRASPAKQDPDPEPSEVPAGSYGDFLDCWAAFPFVTDLLLRKALGFADARGWFDGAGSPEDRIIAGRLRESRGRALG